MEDTKSSPQKRNRLKPQVKNPEVKIWKEELFLGEKEKWEKRTLKRDGGRVQRKVKHYKIKEKILLRQELKDGNGNYAKNTNSPRLAGFVFVHAHVAHPGPHPLLKFQELEF